MLHILTDLKEFNAKIAFQKDWDFFHSGRKSDKTTLMTFSALQTFSSFLLMCQTFQLNLIFIKKKNGDSKNLIKTAASAVTMLWTDFIVYFNGKIEKKSFNQMFDFFYSSFLGKVKF